MHPLIFSRDGVLRRSLNSLNPDKAEQEQPGKKHIWKAIPLLAWEAEEDPDVFLKSLHDTVFFEPGLTVGEFFENLAPWADTMRGVACMDFPAFLAEARKDPDKAMDEVENITISYCADISAVPKFDTSDAASEDGFFNIGKMARSGKIQIEQGWYMNAILKPERRAEYGGSESVSLSFSPISEWKHLEISIQSDASLSDTTAYKHNSTYLGTEQSLTAADHQNVEVVLNGRDEVLRHSIKISPPAPTFFDTVVRGFLWDVGFHYSPVSRDEVSEGIMNSIGEISDALLESTDNIDEALIASDLTDPPEIDEDDREDQRRMDRLIKVSEEMGLKVG